MDWSPYHFQVMHVTRSDKYFINLWKDGKIIYVSRQYAEAQSAVLECRQHLDPTTDYSAQPDKATFGNFFRRTARVKAGLQPDPAIIDTDFTKKGR